ncbi:MAG: hypothetical protein B0D92_00215 [Spirochaeta sp. LUC14_002_19_P3]|nr:MAG: hypothetical protein B0D92_00215 [Spirochaeta sp. LUC14_002_19_P3]
MVVSGINYGENIGSDVTVSGTVGAAIQAAVWGIKAVAVSLEVSHEFHFQYGKVDWSAAVAILRRTVPRLLGSEWPPDVDIIKIDIPGDANSSTPWKMCRQSREPGWWGLTPNAHPESEAGDVNVHRGPRAGHAWGMEDDGAVLLNERRIAITPLSINMTSRVPLPDIQKLMNEFPGNPL